jgi:ABC-type transport system involved in multi-copper enzyme maturation permease subunit
LLLHRQVRLRPLFAKELRDLLAGRTFWITTVILCFVVGYGFIEAVALYAEASRSAASFPDLARGLSPLDGILVPTFGAFYVATTLLFPFVAIRAVGAEKQNGGLKLLLQLPYRPTTIVAAKLFAILTAWLVGLVPGLSALLYWVWLGGHLAIPETACLLFGHFLYSLLVATTGLFAATLAESTSTAAIMALGCTLGAWVLDFAATGQAQGIRALAEFSPTAALRSFEVGLLSLPAVLGLVIGASMLTSLAIVWLSPGTSLKYRSSLSAVVLASTVLASGLASQARYYVDVSEDRRNSFTPADEATLRRLADPLAITVFLAPDDPRMMDFDRTVLSKLRRIVPHLSITIAKIPKGLFAPASDDRYGLVMYDYAGKHDESRSTSPREVLPILYDLATVTPGPSTVSDYPGYPLAADSPAAAVWFYGVLPLLFVLLWWRARRARAFARPNFKGGTS